MNLDWDDNDLIEQWGATSLNAHKPLFDSDQDRAHMPLLKQKQVLTELTNTQEVDRFNANVVHYNCRGLIFTPGRRVQTH